MDVPVFGEILGKSTLFDFGDSLEAQPSTRDEDVENCTNVNVTNDDDMQYERVHAFITSKGKVIPLKKKPRDHQQRCTEWYLAKSGGDRAVWKQDETYGVNINALLDRIEARSSDEGSRGIDKNNVPMLRPKNKLWVEKWRPRNFLDLVGNERTNRRVLRWLRQWSPAVFKEQLPKVHQKEEGEVEFDPLQRPQRRILLIHGPPGIGKTSVAHAVAKQAGYSVAEINASDERAGTLVRDKVNNTLFNHTFNDSPVCLIADEIDGSVEGGFIKVLIDIINRDAKATQKLIFGSNTKSKTKKRKAASQLLLRPIIAICNNLYAPALDKLKPHCEIISFKRPSDSSLLERLERICQVEELKIPVKSLKELMDLAQGDVRNCINNLQFLASHQKLASTASEQDLEQWDSSSKDYSLSWFKICNTIFKKDPHKDSKQLFQELARQVEINGNFDKLVLGCHSLFPHVKYSDNGVTKPAAISDWLCFHDLMLKSMFEHNGELLRYSTVVPLAFFHFFGDIANREDIRIKNSDFELRELQKSTLDISRLILHKMSVSSPYLLPFTSQESLIYEILPYLDNMISSDLNKCKDLKIKQSMFETLVELLKTFQLKFVENRQDGFENRNILSVEPPIEKIVLLDPTRQREVTTKRPAVLNLLLSKFEESKVRKRHLEQATEKRSRNEEIKSKRAKTGMNGVSSFDFFRIQYGLNNDDKSQSNSSDSIAGKNENSADSVNTKNVVRIWVKYKEGFSDAVRKNVSWNNLWE